MSRENAKRRTSRLEAVVARDALAMRVSILDPYLANALLGGIPSFDRDALVLSYPPNTVELRAAREGAARDALLFFTDRAVIVRADCDSAAAS